MVNVFIIVILLSIIALIIGLIKPKIVIRWKQDATRKDVFRVYGLAIFVSFVMGAIAVPSVEKKEAIVTEEQKIEPTKIVEQATIDNQQIKIDTQPTPSTEKINVLLNETVENDNGIIIIKGTTNLPNNTKLIIYISNDLYGSSNTVEVLNGEFVSSTFTNCGKPLFNGKYEISIRSISFNEQPKNVQNLIGENGVNLVGKLIAKNEYSDDNNLRYLKSYTIENSIDIEEIVSVTSTNLKQVIKSLKDNYNIVATAFNNEKLNKYKMCSNDRFCEVYADTVQIQALNKMIDVLTSSQVTPLYYQKVCSATMIALTGANKELIEQLIPQYFNYASMNGRSKWEILGIEVTIGSDSQNLLGCSFYKKKE